MNSILDKFATVWISNGLWALCENYGVLPVDTNWFTMEIVR